MKTIKNIVVVDMRDADELCYLASGYKLIPYILSLESNLALRIYHLNLNQNQTKFQVGWNIFNQESKPNLAQILKPLGGGGHKQVGSVTVDTSQADSVYQHLIKKLTE